ncbi:MAG: putative GCN5-related N-acetyltransferase [Thermoleophilia bacterium]|nr:putative GCN5-related N-acetyltransferase [Thermoleophilia bacterium]
MIPAERTVPATPLSDVGRVQVVPADGWDELVTRLARDDTYLSLAYHHASVALEPAGTVPVLLHFRDQGGEVALPLLLRPLADGTGWDATSAYGYGGPLAIGRPDLAGFAGELDAWAVHNDVVATFLRFHPLLGNVRWAPPGAEVVELGATVAWHVAAGRDLMADMHSHHRRVVRKAERAELVVDVVTQPGDLSEFRALYDVTMQRQQADAFYFFADRYWQALVAEPGLELVLVNGRLDDQLVASLLCFADGHSLHYHLGASAPEARNIGASNRCFLTAAEWAQARGLQQFHLGGGVGAGTDSPLFVFKHRYDPTSEPKPFHIAKLVHDQGRYAELAGTTSTAGFFPPWRGREQ